MIEAYTLKPKSLDLAGSLTITRMLTPEKGVADFLPDWANNFHEDAVQTTGKAK